MEMCNFSVYGKKKQKKHTHKNYGIMTVYTLFYQWAENYYM
jgi:hypothetical protein